MKFEEFSFVPALQQAIAEIGFVDCTPVQAQSFTAYFEGKDIYTQSQTGTGKTAAFMLCGLQELIRRNRQRAQLEGREFNEEQLEFAADIKMLILCPTRELAEQIEQEAKSLSKFLSLQVAAFYGGVGYERQRAHLDSGVQIITGTPGRVIDLAESGELPLDQVQILVLDEADRMLDMGFIDDVRWVMGKVVPPEQRLTMLFSATLNAKVGNLTWEFMRPGEIAEIVVEPEQVTTENVAQELYHVSNQEKLRLLLSLIKKHDPPSAIIFCNTKSGVSFIEGRLRANGYQVKALMGDLPQVKRTQIVGQLKAAALRFVVATDVASRGLHIDGLPLVINYDLPDEAENYVHRIGRTARAGACGRAISLACERYVYNLAEIERYIGNKIPVSWFPEDELVKDLGRERQLRSEHRNGRGERRERDSQDKRENGNSPDTSGRRDHKAHTRGGPQAQRAQRAGLPKATPKNKAERMEYYQQKYGEDFGVAGGRRAAGPDTSSNISQDALQDNSLHPAPNRHEAGRSAQNQTKRKRRRNAQNGPNGNQNRGQDKRRVVQEQVKRSSQSHSSSAAKPDGHSEQGRRHSDMPHGRKGRGPRMNHVPQGKRGERVGPGGQDRPGRGGARGEQRSAQSQEVAQEQEANQGLKGDQGSRKPRFWQRLFARK